MRVFYLILSTHILAAAALLGDVSPVVVGEKFHTEVQVPDESRHSFRTYLETFETTQPCADFCLLDGFQELRGGRWNCTFRMTRHGSFEVPLGVFSWRQQSILLPELFIEASPQKAISPTPDWLRLPFLDNIVVVQPQNQGTLIALLQRNQTAGIARISWKEQCRHATGFFLVLAFCAPFCWHFMRDLYEKHKKLRAKEARPEQLLQTIYTLRQKQQVLPWSQLLELLGKMWDEQKSTPTAFELKQLFSSTGKLELAKIADTIENCGYAKNMYTEQFDQALNEVQILLPRIKIYN